MGLNALIAGKAFLKLVMDKQSLVARNHWRGLFRQVL